MLGVNYDACNIFRAGYVESGNNTSGYRTMGGGENELEVLKAISSRVVHCHAKDINAEQKCVPIGEGLVNVKGCVDHLREIGYSGVVSVETEGSNGSFEEVVALAKKSYDYLSRVIRGENA